ncbi:MAG: FAD-binding oxidoreductase [Mycobacteriales bacterium]
MTDQHMSTGASPGDHSIGAVAAALATNLRGRVIQPADGEYETARRMWNAMIDRYPALIVQPADETDVATTVTFARRHRLPLAVRGGAHNVAGKGTCDNGLVIDLSTLDTIAVDPDARTATAGGGVRWGPFDAATAVHGLAATGGVISTTGIGGLTLGGGIGWLMRKYGLACDNLISVRLVTADGEIRTVDGDREPELWWALRGGGGNFGVVTSFTFRLHPVSTVLGGMMLYRANRMTEALAAYTSWVTDLPDSLTTMGAFLSAPPLPFVPPELHGTPMLAVALCGTDVDAAGDQVARLSAMQAPDVEMIAPMPYPAVQAMLDASAPPGLRSYWKSGYLPTLDPALTEAIVLQANKPVSPLSMIHLHHMGGALDRMAGDRAAGVPAGVTWAINIIGLWDDAPRDAENIAWVRDLWGHTEPHAEGVYLNFLGEEGASRVRAAYQPGDWDRLIAVKTRWDPDNAFHQNQNIPPTGG